MPQLEILARPHLALPNTTTPSPEIRTVPNPFLPDQTKLRLIIYHDTQTLPIPTSPHHASPRLGNHDTHTEPYLTRPNPAVYNQEALVKPCLASSCHTKHHHETLTQPDHAPPHSTSSRRGVMSKLCYFFEWHFYRCELFNFVTTMTGSPVADANVATCIF